MKIKEILKNKWGWVGAVIGIITVVMAFGLGMAGIDSSAMTLYQKILFFPLTISESLSSVLRSVPIIGNLFVTPIFNIIGSVVIWFILGLIAQKLWGKFG